MGRKMSEVKNNLMQDNEFLAAYVELQDELALAGQLIEARKKAHLTQDEVAKKMEQLSL